MGQSAGTGEVSVGGVLRNHEDDDAYLKGCTVSGKDTAIPPFTAPACNGQ